MITNNLFSEEKESFTAREGYNALINNSELDINKKFDLIYISNEKSYGSEEREYFSDSTEKWKYGFKSKDTLDNDGYTYSVTFSNGVYSYELQIFDGIEAQSILMLNNDWLDSDKLILELEKNAPLLGFFQKNKNFISSMTIQLRNYPPSDYHEWNARIYIYPPYSAYCSYNSINLELISCNTPSSVQDIIEESNIQPNPASDFIEINIDNKENQPFVENDIVQIFNIFGIEIITTPYPLLAKDGEIRIDISLLPKGVYYIKIGDKVEKFVKM
jgi:hypothetical protein